MWMFLACLGSANGQTPTEPLEGPVESATSLAFHDQLAAAKTAINRGENRAAREMLEDLSRRLEAGEAPPTSIAHEALVYLGDLRYVEGEQDGARDAFRRVLLDDPEYVISPYHHTQEVRAFFALVRDQVEKELAQIPPPDPTPLPRVPPLPLRGYAPFGIPQLSEGRTSRGLLFGGLQVAFVASSVATYVIVDRANVDPDRPGGHPFNWSRDEVPGRVRILRYGVQWPSSALFYGTWVASVIEASGEWRRSHRAPGTTVYVTPTGIGVGGRF